jgi:hypothetical protein
MSCNHTKCRICKKCHYPGCTNYKPCRVDRESKNNSRYKRYTLRRLTFEEELELDRFVR